MSEPVAPSRLERDDGATIAYHGMAGKSPGVIFCGGLKSDMTGTKAQALEAHCRAAGRAFLRFDYFGHGASSGAFRDGTVGRWAEDALAVLDALTEGPQIIVGSSLGGWIMLLVALARPDRVAGLVGVAAAPDFVDALWHELDDEAKRELETTGLIRRPSEYSDQPYEIALKLIEEGRTQKILDKAPLAIRCPVRLLHGMADPDVPWHRSLDVAAAVESGDVTVTLVKDGDHRLSEPADIARLTGAVDDLAVALGG